MALEIKITKKQDYAYTVELNGSLDNETYNQFIAEVGEIVDDKTKAVVFDLAGLSYISSAGIGAVLNTKKALKQRGSSSAIVNIQPQIKKVFDAMKIMPMVNILDDATEADMFIDAIIKLELAKQDA
ncbi:STAS domain-containing protein [Candidatus Omnitrophota bacterium]